MADIRDPEKESAETDKESIYSSRNGARDNGTPLTQTLTASSSDDASSSHETINSDPLSPLEHALTPDLRTPAEHAAAELTHTQTATSFATNASRPPDFEVDFTTDDPDDPRNWPIWYKSLTIVAVSFATWTVVLYSTSYTSSMPGMMTEFGITSEPIATLGVTMYLVGLACGSLILAPLSEIWGRRPIYIVSLLCFCLLILPCALSTSLAEVLVVRFFGAMFGSAMIANSPGTVADITTETYRALAFSVWSIGPMNGPVTGPLIGGFAAQYLGWRWTNWLVMIFSGVGWAMCAAIKETYAPAILKKKAERRRKETGDDRWWCRYDQKLSIWAVLKVNLSRPFVMTFTEPILWFWDAYIAIIYGILYLCFVAFPLIYQRLRGWSAGFTGLAFLGIGTGTMLGIFSEPLVRRMIHAHKRDPATGRPYPEASVSIICIAAILIPVGQLWFSWTSVPITIHWIWPILSGIPFGAGNCLVFIYSSNYLASSYGIYSASALAGNSVIRSFIGGTLPLAGPAMYAKMTPQWAGTFLGLLEVALIPIPFVFYKWGAQIRERSPLIRRLREDQERSEQRAAKARKALARKNGGEPTVVEEGEVVGNGGLAVTSDDGEKLTRAVTGERTINV